LAQRHRLKVLFGENVGIIFCLEAIGADCVGIGEAFEDGVEGGLVAEVVDGLLFEAELLGAEGFGEEGLGADLLLSIPVLLTQIPTEVATRTLLQRQRISPLRRQQIHTIMHFRLYSQSHVHVVHVSVFRHVAARLILTFLEAGQLLGFV